ncbi:hypothetical protein [Actinoallomurus sp. NPDC052274]|uniref:hypothetical protein n=1 Tax=Actinoallomurus sp. NPDC052274 TaxID=3155420 RepID=UPI003445817B
MPRGTYVHEPGVEERFACDLDGGGWRYTAERSDGGTIELVADSRWRPARLQVTVGEHVLRGGAVGAELMWVTAGREHAARATGFLGESPGLLVAVARSLRLAERERVDLRILLVTAPSLAVRTVPQRWSLAEIAWHDADGERVPVERYEITDLETGEVSEFHLAGDVVVAAPGIELVNLENPPNFS